MTKARAKRTRKLTPEDVGYRKQQYEAALAWRNKFWPGSPLDLDGFRKHFLVTEYGHVLEEPFGVREALRAGELLWWSMLSPISAYKAELAFEEARTARLKVEQRAYAKRDARLQASRAKKAA